MRRVYESADAPAPVVVRASRLHDPAAGWIDR